MSGSQTYSEMINQPAASDAEVAAGTYPLLVTGASETGGSGMARRTAQPWPRQT
jgi:hypothetical protein